MVDKIETPTTFERLSRANSLLRLTAACGARASCSASGVSIDGADDWTKQNFLSQQVLDQMDDLQDEMTFLAHQFDYGFKPIDSTDPDNASDPDGTLKKI